MDARIIFYKQDGLDQNTKFMLRRDLLGLEQKSNFARYKYEVKGLLDTIPHYKPVRSTIIVEDKNVANITTVLTKYKATFEVFDIKVPRTKLNKK